MIKLLLAAFISLIVAVLYANSKSVADYEKTINDRLASVPKGNWGDYNKAEQIMIEMRRSIALAKEIEKNGGTPSTIDLEALADKSAKLSEITKNQQVLSSWSNMPWKSDSETLQDLKIMLSDVKDLNRTMDTAKRNLLDAKKDTELLEKAKQNMQFVVQKNQLRSQLTTCTNQYTAERKNCEDALAVLDSNEKAYRTRIDELKAKIAKDQRASGKSADAAKARQDRAKNVDTAKAEVDAKIKGFQDQIANFKATDCEPGKLSAHGKEYASCKAGVAQIDQNIGVLTAKAKAISDRIAKLEKVDDELVKEAYPGMAVDSLLRAQAKEGFAQEARILKNQLAVASATITKYSSLKSEIESAIKSADAKTDADKTNLEDAKKASEHHKARLAAEAMGIQNQLGRLSIESAILGAQISGDQDFAAKLTDIVNVTMKAERDRLKAMSAEAGGFFNQCNDLLGKLDRLTDGKDAKALAAIAEEYNKPRAVAGSMAPGGAIGGAGAPRQ